MGRFSDRGVHSGFSIEKYRSVLPLGGKGLPLVICEKEKRWCLLASQTGVILLATLLLFLSSYLISARLWLGRIVGEQNEETAFMAVFSFYRLLHRKRYWKPFMLHLRFPLFHPLICLRQLLWERTLDTDKYMMNISCLYVCLSLKYKSVMCPDQYQACRQH